MAYSRTLLQIRSRALYLGDIQTAAGNAARHPTADVNAEINESHRDLLSLLKTRGFDFNLIETAQANLPTTRADTNEAYSEVAWPTGSAFIKRVDVLVGGMWTELTRRDWAQLRSEFRLSGGTAARPLVWAPKSEGSVATTNFTAGKLALAPFCPTAGKYKITYQPEWVDVSADGDLLLYPDPNCASYVVWDVVVKFASRDRDSKKQYDIAQAQRTKCAEAIGEFVPEIADTGPMSMTRGPDYFT